MKQSSLFLFIFLSFSSFAADVNCKILSKTFLKEHYFGEDIGKSGAMRFRTVRYVKSLKKQQSYRVSLADNGLIYGNDGNLYNTPSHVENMFVLDLNGYLYIAVKRGIDNDIPMNEELFHHSSILNGAKEIGGAGKIIVKNGKITFFSDSSGHYLPRGEVTLQVLKYLHTKGIDLSKTELFFTTEFNWLKKAHELKKIGIDLKQIEVLDFESGVPVSLI